jgi:hypothetical protein
LEEHVTALAFEVDLTLSEACEAATVGDNVRAIHPPCTGRCDHSPVSCLRKIVDQVYESSYCMLALEWLVRTSAPHWP